MPNPHTDQSASSANGLEQARLEGVKLAVRTAQHEMNNRLALTLGYAQIVLCDPALPPHLRDLVAAAADGVRQAAAVLEQLGELTCLHQRDWGGSIEPTIDLSRSIEAPRCPTGCAPEAA